MRSPAARLLVFGLLAAFAASAQPSKTAAKEDRAVPYFPTPPTIVERMLRLSELKPGEKMFDLGSGDGRIVIMAAEKFKADATGVEYNESLYKQSSAEIRRKGLASKARIIHGDMYAQDYSSADVITVYLLPSATDKITPLLTKQLKKGTRIIAHDFQFEGWKAEKVENIEDDGEGRSHTLYVYRR